jgi:hypothetical protein
VIFSGDFLWSKWSGKTSQKRGEKRRRMRDRGGVRGLTTVRVPDGNQWQNSVAPASDFSETKASPVLDPERNERGEEGRA